MLTIEIAGVEDGSMSPAWCLLCEERWVSRADTVHTSWSDIMGECNSCAGTGVAAIPLPEVIAEHLR